MNTITCNLILKTCDLTTTMTNNGIKSANNEYFQFNNIDFRKLMGNYVYDLYDYFNIVLVYGLAAVPANALVTAYDSSISTIQLQGLQFCNNNISTSYINNPRMQTESTYDCGFYNVSTANTYAFQNLQPYGAMFEKQSVANLKIAFYDATLSTLIQRTNGDFPNWVFVFKIIGVPRKQIRN